MGKEIERKYLVQIENLPPLSGGVLLRQGYIHSDLEKTIRVRISESKAWLTIKGPQSGMTRNEFEYEIPHHDALGLWEMCGARTLEKVRYHFDYAGNLWEIDEFRGRHQGLWLAEIELKTETQEFQKPTWVGKEVTQDFSYANSSLCLR